MSDFNQSPPSKDQLDLVYGLDDRPKPLIAFLAAFQHLLAIIVPIVTPGLLICLALGVSKEDTNMILSMSLVISGIATFYSLKSRAIWCRSADRSGNQFQLHRSNYWYWVSHGGCGYTCRSSHGVYLWCSDCRCIH